MVNSPDEDPQGGQLVEGQRDDDRDVSETVDFALSLFEECNAEISLANLESILFLFQQILNNSLENYQLRFHALQGLGFASGIRYVCTKDRKDLARFLKLRGSEKNLTTLLAIRKPANVADSEEQGMLVTARSSLDELRKTTSLSTLNTVILLLRQSLPLLSPKDSQRPVVLIALACARYMRFQHLHHIADINHAFYILEHEVHVYDAGRQQDVNVLRSFLAVTLLGERSDARLKSGLNLAQKFETSGDLEDLERGIQTMKLSIMDIPPYSPNYNAGLDNLGSALLLRFSQRGDNQDIEDAILFYSNSLEMKEIGHPGRFQSLSNLANGMVTRFCKQGDTRDLDGAVALYRQALELAPSAQPDQFHTLTGLAVALSAQFERQGNAQDLDESISLYRRALELRPPPHPNCDTALHNLATALFSRFEQRGDEHDLEEAILDHRQALSLRPLRHPDRQQTLNGLANALALRHKELSEARDGNEAISFYRQALDLTPPRHPSRVAVLNNLANGLGNRFLQFGDILDVDEAISLQRQAMELIRPPHPDYPRFLDSAATSLLTRFDHQSDPRDLEQAMSFQQEALEHLPFDDPYRPNVLSHFALLYISAFEKATEAPDPSHLEQAMQFFSEAALSIPQSSYNRFLIAKTWADYAGLYEHSSALQASETALAMLPELAALNLDIQSRQDSLAKETDGLARKAARCAICVGDLGKAVEFLETGRSVFWSQFLALRSPLDKLRDDSPQLAEEILRISQELERGSHREKTIGHLTNSQRLSLEDDARKFERLSQEWAEGVNKVRQLDGYQDFLLPQRLAALQGAAKTRTIVYLVANDDASDCLIMTLTDVYHIPLPELHSGVLAALVELVRMATSPYRTPRSMIDEIVQRGTNVSEIIMEILRSGLDEPQERGTGLGRRTQDKLSSDEIFGPLLRFLWDELVKPIIDFLDLKKSSTPPTLTWCPTGLFTFLPIHGAGLYAEGAVDCASDYFTSSYTPTIGALLSPSQRPVDPFKMIAVIQPHTLPSTAEELEKIKEYVSDDSLDTFGAWGKEASVEEVATHLSAASIVHFACHGKQDSTNPLKSGLIIEDDRLTIARIMKESVPNGALAFLSACETAKGDENIPDEAINIGTSLLFTGFKSVVATMWKMWDEDGPVIAEAFYAELFRGPDGNPMRIPDTCRSAEALAKAVNKLRSSGVEFRRWVQFVHMGK